MFVVAYVACAAMGASMSLTLASTQLALNRLAIPAVYLAVTAALLVYLGRHEARLRTEIERLARWPAADGPEPDGALGRVLQQAAQTLGAGHVLVTWESAEEPWTLVTSWSAPDLTVTTHGPGHFDSVVPVELAQSVILCDTPLTYAAVALVSTNGHASEWRGLPIHPELRRSLGGPGLASAPFQTARISGRVFFSNLGGLTVESIVVTQVVARAVGESLDQMQSARHLRDIGGRDQRIVLTRDLYDDVLQSLTGIRFQLAAVADGLADDSAAAGRDRLLAIERALAIEQRQLRLFIDDLKPGYAAVGEDALTSRLQDLGEQVRLEWKIPVTIRINQHPAALPDRLEQAIPMMAREAIVNAAKHAQPSRISVDVMADEGMLRLVVSDDGCGFPFRGRFDHRTLTAMNLGPASLREHAAALGGHLMIDSTASGSRVGIAVPTSRN
jgi:signal transduction histidine kinase